MGLLESINEHLRRLPESEQAEVLDFVNFLETKKNAALGRELTDWSSLSLDAAMVGIDSDDTEPDYSAHDIKVRYQ